MMRRFGTVLAMAAFLLGLGVFDAWVYCRAQVSASYRASDLTWRLGRQVLMDSLSFDLSQGAVARQVRIPRSAGDPGREPLVEIRAVRVEPDLLALIHGQWAVRNIELVEPRIQLRADGRGLFPLLEMIRTMRREPEAAPGVGPRIAIRDGRIDLWHAEFLKAEMDRHENIQELHDVNVILTPGHDPGWYSVEGSCRADPFGQWSIHGFADQAQRKIWISLRAENLQLSAFHARRFGGTAERIWNNYQPQGPMDLDVRVAATIPEGGAPPAVQFYGRADLKGLSGRAVQFPYSAAEVTGALEFTRERIGLVGITGQVGGGRFFLSGYSGGYTSDAAVELDLRIENLELDEALRETLVEMSDRERAEWEEDRKARGEAAGPDPFPASPATLWTKVNPGGVIDATVHVSRPEGTGRRTDYTIRAFCNDCRATYADFPLPMNHITGALDITSGAVTLRDLCSREGDRSVMLSGEIGAGGADAALSLRIHGRGVRGDAELMEALFPDVRKAIAPFHLGGLFDVEWEMDRARGPDQPTRQVVRVHGRDMTAQYDEFPLFLQHVSGDAEYHPGEPSKLTLKHIEGEWNQARVTLDGTVTPRDKGTDCDLRIGGSEFPVNAALRKALPEDLRSIFESARDGGSLDFNVDLAHRGSPGGGPERDYSATINLVDTALEIGLPLEDILGTLDVHGEMRAGSHSADGRFRARTARVYKKQIEDLSGRMVYDQKNLTFLDVKGSAYSGLIGGWAQVQLDTKDWKSEFQLRAMDLKEFVRDTFAAGKPISGRMNGRIALQGKGKDTASLKGQDGQLSIEEGELWDVPAMLKISDIYSFGANRRDRFKRGAIEFDLTGDVVKVRKLQLEGNKGVIINGRGKMDLDGNLALVVEAKVPPGGLSLIPGLGLFSDALDALWKGTTSTELVGTFKDPVINVRPANFLGGSDPELPREKKQGPSPSQAPPVPAVPPPPEPGK